MSTTAQPVDPDQTRSLIARHAFVSAMLDALAEGIVACDADGRLVLFNRATMDFHGLPALDLPPEEWATHYDLYAADGATRLERDQVPLFRALNGEEVRNQGMVIAPRAGATRHLLASGRQILDDDGTVLGAVVAMHDVTDQLAAEERARDAAVERARAEQLKDLHATTARLRAVEDLDQLEGELRAGALALTDALACDVIVGGAGGLAPSVEPEGTGASVTVDDAGVALRARFAVPPPPATTRTLQELVAVAAAVVESWRLRTTLLESRAAQLRDELIAAVSHDIQTPAAAVIGLAQTLAQRAADLSPQELTAVGSAMHRQARQLHGLVTQFMDHCRIEAGHGLALRTTPVDLGTVATMAVELRAERDRIRTEATPGTTVLGDEGRLVRMVGNLLDNALAYSDGDVIVTVHGDDDRAQVVVRDHGPGLGDDPEVLFTRYARGNDETDGSGLGLYISRAVVEAHGGTLVAHDADAGGAVVTATFPVAP